MILSMTGYGKSAADSKKLTVEAEIKSVNSRYLDINMRVPGSLLSKEYEIRELIKSKIKRGKISLTIQLKENGQGESEIFGFDKEKLKTFIQVIKQLKKEAKISEKIKLEHLLSNKEIFAGTSSGFSEAEFLLVKKSLNSAISDLFKMKKDEGKELAKDLKKRISIIENNLSLIEKESASSVNEYFEKFKEKVKVLIEGAGEYNERLELELALIAEKSDITEECVRLRSHLKFFLESIETSEEPGRKLNFLCQEMNREANTISSKSVAIEIIHTAVLIKEEIERIREQIQNIE
jgi:uncharacterized protein (TIGR00255 family)